MLHPVSTQIIYQSSIIAGLSAGWVFCSLRMSSFKIQQASPPGVVCAAAVKGLCMRPCNAGQTDAWSAQVWCFGSTQLCSPFGEVSPLCSWLLNRSQQAKEEVSPSLVTGKASFCLWPVDKGKDQKDRGWGLRAPVSPPRTGYPMSGQTRKKLITELASIAWS